ncbi:MAG: hypothetical protein ACRC8Y_05755 [Chroococcales cyanobacterium]
MFVVTTCCRSLQFNVTTCCRSLQFNVTTEVVLFVRSNDLLSFSS